MFELKKLPYELNALEPVISQKLLELHYLKHHQTYTDNFNKALQEYNLTEKSLPELFTNISNYPKIIENQGGGYYNHQFFWESLCPENSDAQRIGEKILIAIDKSFGSYENFQKEFKEKALSLFGSGWVWLVENPDLGILEIHQSFNQESPEMDFMIERNGKVKPLLSLDVWEHAYYPDYENRRADFIDNFWRIVNWQKVEERFLNNENK